MKKLTEHEIKAVSGGLDNSQLIYIASLTTQALAVGAYVGLNVLAAGRMPAGFVQERVFIPCLSILGVAIGSELGNRLTAHFRPSPENNPVA